MASTAVGKVDFAKVLEKSNNILASQGQHAPNRSLAQLSATIRKVIRERPEVGAEINAQLFFARQGIDLTKQAATLRNLNLSQTFEVVEPADDLDVDAFLEHQQELLIASTVEECAKLSALAEHAALVGQLEADWEQVKREILENMHFEIKSVGAGSHTFNVLESAALSAAAAATAGTAVGHATTFPSPAQAMLQQASWNAASSAANTANTEIRALITEEQQLYARTVAELNVHITRFRMGQIERYQRYIQESDAGSAVAQTAFQESELRAMRELVTPLQIAAAFREAAALYADHAQTALAQAHSAVGGSALGVGVGSLYRSAASAAALREADAAASLASAATDMWDLVALLVESFVEATANQQSAQGATLPLALQRRRRLVTGATRFLERIFLQHVQTIVGNVDADLEAGGYGSQASVYGDAVISAALAILDEHSNSQVAAASRELLLQVDAYTRSPEFAMRCRQDAVSVGDGTTGTVGDVSVSSPWAKVYLCMRCGDVLAALALVRTMFARGASVQLLATCLELHATGSDLGRYWEPLWREFGKEDTFHADPFRTMVYHVVGRFRLDPIVQRDRIQKYVVLNVEDYLWEKLHGLWLQPTAVPAFAVPKEHQSQLSLEDLQLHVLKLGEKHFNPQGSSPLMFPTVLLLTQQFEHAIYLLLRQHETLAVHLTLMLAMSGLLNVAHPDNDVLVPLSMANQQQRLASRVKEGAKAGALIEHTLIDQDTSMLTNFALNVTKIIMRYANSFSKSHPVEACHYYATLQYPATTSTIPLPNVAAAIAGLWSGTGAFTTAASASSSLSTASNAKQAAVSETFDVFDVAAIQHELESPLLRAPALTALAVGLQEPEVTAQMYGAEDSYTSEDIKALEREERTLEGTRMEGEQTSLVEFAGTGSSRSSSGALVPFADHEGKSIVSSLPTRSLARRADVRAVIDQLITTGDVDNLVGVSRDLFDPTPVRKGPLLVLYPGRLSAYILTTAAECLAASNPLGAARLFALANMPARCGRVILAQLAQIASVVNPAAAATTSSLTGVLDGGLNTLSGASKSRLPNHALTERERWIHLATAFIDRYQDVLNHEGYSEEELAHIDALASTADSTQSGKGSNSSTIPEDVELAVQIRNAYISAGADGITALADTVRTLVMVRALAEFFSFFSQGPESYADAISVVEPLGLLPDIEDVQELEGVQTAFQNLDPTVRRLYGPFATALMEVYQVQYDMALRTSADANTIATIRRRARTLLLFVTNVQLEGVGREVHAKLMRINSSLG